MSLHDFVSVVPPGDVTADLLVIGCFEKGEAPTADLPEPVRRAVEALGRRPGFEGRQDQHVETSVDRGSVGAVALRGLGPAEELDGRELRCWIREMTETATRSGVTRLALRLPAHRESAGEAAAARVVQLAALCDYQFHRYRTRERKDRSRLERVEVVPPPAELEAYRRGAAAGRAVAAGVTLARDLGNTPANVAHPEWMEEQAAELADAWSMELTVLGPGELEERGMGGILAVGRGSSVPPRLVRLDVGEGERALALVGKGVTFDTGGISIKPAADMDEMKYDKMGACTVLGVARTVAELELPVRLRVYVPLAENMPDGAAYRPGDVVRCYDGQTVEIVNTDAEGRMLLADALAWAVEEEPDTVLEYSTLTGSAVIALGHTGAALFTPRDELAHGLLEAARRNGERLWRMPLWPEFAEAMRGVHADLKNSGGRWGGAATAAAFLSRFVGDHPSWAHLDIAGPAYVGNDRDEPKGATGYGVATTVDWLRQTLP